MSQTAIIVTPARSLSGAAGLVYRRTSLAAGQLLPRTVMQVVFLAASTSLVYDSIRRRLARPGRQLATGR